MNREEKIDYQILKCVNEGKNTKDDEIVNTVFKKFVITNLFRINKIYKVEIYNRLLNAIDKGWIKAQKTKKRT